MIRQWALPEEEEESEEQTENDAKPLREWKVKGKLGCIDQAPMGSYLVTGGAAVSVWDSQSEKNTPVNTKVIPDILSVAFQPLSDNTLGLTTKAGFMSLFDVRTGDIGTSFTLPRNGKGLQVYKWKWSPSKEHEFIVASHSGCVYTFDKRKTTMHSTVYKAEKAASLSPVLDVAFSSDGQYCHGRQGQHHTDVRGRTR